MEQIEGIVENIIYSNDQNGYMVCEIRSGRRLVTLVGYIPGLGTGETVCVNGSWNVHQDYGKQFKVESFERRLPNTRDAILRYLSSGVIKGIGEVTARKMLDKFGEETFKILQFDCLRMAEIKGISPDKALRIGQAFIEQEQIRQVVMFFQKFGISATYAVKVWKKFGRETMDEIKRNPYRLTDEEINIGFKTADRLALSMGMDVSSKFRLVSGIRYILSKAVRDGHVYLPEDILVHHAVLLLNSEAEATADALVKMTLEDTVVKEKADMNRVYLSAFFKAEQYVCRKISVLNETEPRRSINNLKEVLSEVETEQQVEYACMQREAIRCSVDSGMLIITGGPGTGKTTLLKGMLAVFKKQNMKIALAAPTGRAAKRMTEATGSEAKTLHRLLEMDYQGDETFREFKKNERDPIDADVVIIDEVSMVDILLMHALLKAIEPGTRLILVGDVDQLPSVGPGKVLSDMIESGILRVVRLNQIFRQAEESMIVINAHRINKGQYPEIDAEKQDFFIIPRYRPEDTANTVLELCTRRIPKKFKLDPMKDIQVLSPTKKGAAGIFNLNTLLQKQLNPPGRGCREKACRDVVFRENDRVMQIKNNYSLRWRLTEGEGETIAGEGVFNGDMGIISQIDLEERFLTVTFDDGKIVEYDFDTLDELELSYAITVHKSQGSEFPVVVIALSGLPSVMLCRNLLYTAVTRARQMVVLVGDPNMIKGMIGNATGTRRYTGLREKLIACGIPNAIQNEISG